MADTTATSLGKNIWEVALLPALQVNAMLRLLIYGPALMSKGCGKLEFKYSTRVSKISHQSDSVLTYKLKLLPQLESWAYSLIIGKQ